MANILIYDKDYTSPKELVSKLKSMGMIIENEEKATEFLTNINYYRFKIYFRPFIDIATKTFRDDSTFEKALQLYRFDDELRDFLFSIIGRMEVKIRTRLDQAITKHTNDPFWYLNAENFSTYNARHISGFNEKFINSKDDFVVHYRENYKNPKNLSYPQMPPFWMMAELTTFGDILHLFKNLNKDKFVSLDNPNINMLDTLSKEFGASSLDVFNSWLLSLKETRNRCAHHARLWNRNCAEVKGIQGGNSRFKIQASRNNRLYTALFVVHHISKNIGIERNVKDEFLDLLDKYPEVKNHLNSIGFPPDWNGLNAWNR